MFIDVPVHSVIQVDVHIHRELTDKVIDFKAASYCFKHLYIYECVRVSEYLVAFSVSFNRLMSKKRTQNEQHRWRCVNNECVMSKVYGAKLNIKK